MNRRLSQSAAAFVGVTLFALLAYPSFWLHLYALRELLIGAELLGIMNPKGDLGGQILGHNYQRHPEWAHWLAGALAAAAGFGPALVASILLSRRLSGSARATLCGHCGSPLRDLTTPACPACGKEFRAEGRATRWFQLRRLIVALACFGAAHVYVDRAHRWHIADWIVHQGERAGCMVVREGGFVAGPDGPFFGDSPAARAWNRAYRHAPWLAAAAAGYLAALAAYTITASPRLLGRSRLLGYRGPTRCGHCRYTLAGLREPRCPECGRAI